MWSAPADRGRWTRRALLLSGLASWAFSQPQGKGAAVATAWKRYLDTATEFDVLRLTDPKCSSWLPYYDARSIARHGNFLLYYADNSGSPQAYRMDLHTGQVQQLTAATHLDGASLSLLPDERSCCYCDGHELRQLTFGNLRERTVYQIPEGSQRCAGACVSDDGISVVLGETQGGGSRLLMIGLRKAAPLTVTEAPFVLSEPQPRPHRAQVLYRQADTALWLVNADGAQNRKLSLAPGRIGPARWSPDGHTILYLHVPENSAELHAIRECTPDQNLDKLIARTSQFAHFGVNGDGSVFVGASQSRAAPYILLLLRVTHREFALCEHRATDPAAVAPMFSPDSQQVFFQSDRDGKPAIYRIRVDQLVEKTES
jgi:oligogalacturonide lyase